MVSEDDVERHDTRDTLNEVSEELDTGGTDGASVVEDIAEENSDGGVFAGEILESLEKALECEEVFVEPCVVVRSGTDVNICECDDVSHGGVRCGEFHTCKIDSGGRLSVVV